MKCVQWSDDLSIGIEEIDNQHKQLLEITNKLCEAMDKGEDQSIIETILEDMSDYAFEHFNTEEKYFHQFRYEKTDEHIGQHQFYTNKILTFKSALMAESDAVPAEALSFLMEWIVEHISKSDRDYIQCFKENGLK